MSQLSGKQSKSSDAYYIAKKNNDGSPGKPIGIAALDDANDDGAMLLFNGLKEAKSVLTEIGEDDLSVFKVHMRVIGEVVL